MTDPRNGVIGLFAVASEARGAGLGSGLLRQALRWFRAQGAENVVAVTQGANLGAVRTYERSGFVAQNVQLWFHRWFTTDSENPAA